MADAISERGSWVWMRPSLLAVKPARYFAARSNSVIGRVGYILEICCIFSVLKNKIPPPKQLVMGQLGEEKI